MNMSDVHNFLCIYQHHYSLLTNVKYSLYMYIPHYVIHKSSNSDKKKYNMFYLFQKSEKLDINVLKRSTRSTDGQIRKLQKKNMTDFIQFDKTI